MPTRAEDSEIGFAISDIEIGGQRCFELSGNRILVCNVAGELFAIQQQCSHAAFSLEGGRLTGFEIECPLHGARFDVRDGCATRRPAFRPLATFPIEIRHGKATIRLGDR